MPRAENGSGVGYRFFTAKNIKVVTIGNRVTLRGPVATEAEKSLIETMALRTTGVGHIDNQLEVTR